jgi:hypothetical protein
LPAQFEGKHIMAAQQQSTQTMTAQHPASTSPWTDMFRAAFDQQSDSTETAKPGATQHQCSQQSTGFPSSYRPNR